MKGEPEHSDTTIKRQNFYHKNDKNFGFGTARRNNYITNRRKYRLQIKQANNIKNSYTEFEILKIKGGPFLTPSTVGLDFFDAKNLLDSIEIGFFDDFNP